MDDHNVLFAILQYAWIGLIAVIAWLVKKVYKVEDDASTEEAAVGKDIAVLQTHQKGLRSEFDKEMKRNAIDHDKILEALKQGVSREVIKRRFSVVDEDTKTLRMPSDSTLDEIKKKLKPGKKKKLKPGN